MPKLRKMLGNINSPECKKLMSLIETQSKETLAKWAVEYVEKFLPLIEGDKSAFEEAISVNEKFLSGEVKLGEIKPAIKEARLALGKINGEISEAAARAITAAAAVIQTPTNALGFVFYAAAARAYGNLGLSETAENYEKEARAEFSEAISSLSAVSVENEPNPAKINWNC